jgi:hypothetical protein
LRVIFAFQYAAFVFGVEFEKGKTAIAVPSLDKIPGAIDTLIAAVRNGEFDEQLAQAKKSPIAAKSRKAA